MKNKKITYVEPADYFPENIRKKHKIGEYAEVKETGGEDVLANDKEVETDGTNWNWQGRFSQ